MVHINFRKDKRHGPWIHGYAAGATARAAAGAAAALFYVLIT